MEEKRYVRDYTPYPKCLYVDVAIREFNSNKCVCYRGIIDTGAQQSLISPRVARRLEYKIIVGQKNLRIANDMALQTDVYLCEMKIGDCCFPVMTMAELPMSRDYDVVIGLDALRYCNMTFVT